MTLAIPKIRHIVGLADALQTASARRDRDHPNGASYEPLPETHALLQAIEALPSEQQTELLALMWLGRGDDPTFAEAMERAREWQGSAAVYLIEKSPLSEYLSTGAVSLMRST